MPTSPKRLDPEVERRVMAKARQLVRRRYYPAQDLDDLAQELLCRILPRLERYRADLGRFDAFVDRLLCNAISNMLRGRRTQSRSMARPVRIGPFAREAGFTDGVPEACRAAHRGGDGIAPDEKESRRMELEDLLAALPALLRAYAETRLTASADETRKRLGLGKEAIQRLRAQLGERLRESGYCDDSRRKNRTDRSGKG